MRSLLLILSSAVLVTFTLAAIQAPKQGPGQDPPTPEKIIPPAPQPGMVLALGSLEAFEMALLEALGTMELGDPQVVIIPHASDKEDRGEAEKKAFEAIGAKQVQILENLEGQDTIALLNEMDVIWFADGSPTRLMQNLKVSGMISNFYRWYKGGTLIGGNGQSVGVFGIVYIEGLVSEPLMSHLGVKPRRGLGLWQGLMLPAMLDNNRLSFGISAVLDQPKLIGLGQDNRSAVRIVGDDMFFTGPGSTLVIDPRKAKKAFISDEAAHSVQDVKLHAFAAGEKYTWFQ